MINVIYLDMDGVLVDFNKSYHAMFGVIAREDSNVEVNWFKAVDNNVFYNAPKMEGYDELIDFVLSTGKRVEILSSLSHRSNHHQVRMQKVDWLFNHGLDFLPRNFVRRKLEKAEYATKDSVLIDDSYPCVYPFVERGGYGIQHIDAETTIEQLKKLL